jgi:uncharacterized protein YjiS (DUF1127 family)
MTSAAPCLRHDAASHSGRRQRGFGAIARVLNAVLTKLVDWQERAEQRHHLAGMDERMRKDIGVSYADVLREADKPFWRP